MVGHLHVVRLRSRHARRRRHHHPHADRRRGRGRRHPCREGQGARVRSVGPFRVAAAERLGLRPPFLRDRPAVPLSRGRPDLVRPPRHSDRGRGADSPGHGSRKGVYARHAYPDWRKWTVREAAEIFRKVGSSAISGKFPQPKEVFDMPVAKIHVHEGAFRDSELATIGTAVQAALEEVLSVPPEDYFRITHVLPKGQFVHTPAFVGCTYSERLVLLELTFISGRPKDKRLALLAALNRLVVENVGLRPDDLVVLIYEMPGENISFGQGLAQRAHISA